MSKKQIIKLKQGLLFFAVMLLLAACDQSGPTKIAAIPTYINNAENGLIQEVIKGEIKYSVQYLPIAFQGLKELGFNLTDTLRFKKIISEIEGHHYLLLNINPTQSRRSLAAIYTQKEQNKTWEQVVFELNFHLQKQLILWIGQEAKACQLYHSFPGITLADGLQFMMLFQDKGALLNQSFSEDILFEFEDPYFSNEKITVTFSKLALNKIPKLKI